MESVAGAQRVALRLRYQGTPSQACRKVPHRPQEHSVPRSGQANRLLDVYLEDGGAKMFENGPQAHV